MKPLTMKQLQIIKFMHEFYLVQDQLPTMQFIAGHFGWKSVNAADEQCRVILRKGYLEKNVLGKHKFTAKARLAFGIDRGDCMNLDQKREKSITDLGLLIKDAIGRWEASGCFHARGKADLYRIAMAELIRGRSAEQAQTLETS